MLSLPPSVRIYLCTEPADMRRSFDGLALLAEKINADQLLLFADGAEPAAPSADIEAAPPTSEPTSQAKQKGHGRRALPQ